ncbi:MAG: hypothetical protein WAP74_02135 [Patescibacteria group bacterium]
MSEFESKPTEAEITEQSPDQEEKLLDTDEKYTRWEESDNNEHIKSGDEKVRLAHSPDEWSISARQFRKGKPRADYMFLVSAADEYLSALSTEKLRRVADELAKRGSRPMNAGSHKAQELYQLIDQLEKFKEMKGPEISKFLDNLTWDKLDKPLGDYWKGQLFLNSMAMYKLYRRAGNTERLIEIAEKHLETAYSGAIKGSGKGLGDGTFYYDLALLVAKIAGKKPNQELLDKVAEAVK